MSSDDIGICVVIAAYNAQGTIGRAIASALVQDHVREVIVVDDASSDGTAETARKHDDGSGRLMVIVRERNAGPAAARNLALARSRQPYYCVLDSDDYFLPDRMKKLLAAEPTGWDMIADDIIIVPEELAALPVSVVSHGQRKAMDVDLAKFMQSDLPDPRRPRCEMGFLKPVISRRFLNQNGLRYDERLRLGEDYSLYAHALLANARFRVVEACGYVAIERAASLSTRHLADDVAKLAMLDAEILRKVRTARERAVMRRHLRATLDRLHYRQLLDCKKSHGILPALAMLPRMPGSIPHIVGQTVRARAARLFGAGYNGSTHARRTRLLIGVPGVTLRDAAST